MKTNMRSAADWKRLGSEAEAKDRASDYPARGSDLADDGLRGVLAHYFAPDIRDPEFCDDEEAALDALVDGYRNGG